MKKQWSKEEERIAEFMGLLKEYEMEQIPEEEVLQEKYKLSDLFHQRINTMLAHQRKKAKRKSWIQSMSAIAAGLLIIFLMGNPGLVAEAANRVYEWFADHISFQFRQEAEVDKVPRYRIGYVPEGYELVEDEYYEGIGWISYYNKKGECIGLTYGVIDSAMDVDNENKELLLLKGEKGQKIYYLKGIDNDSSLTWQNEDETVIFNLIGILPEEELMKIYKSITIAEK